MDVQQERDPARERQWVDITDEINALDAAEAEDPQHQTIELDCPPGYPRPGDLIAGVLESTGLVPGVAVKVFGNWTWTFDMDRTEWEQRIQPVVAPRIKRLYEQGLIRYGSW